MVQVKAPQFLVPLRLRSGIPQGRGQCLARKDLGVRRHLLPPFDQALVEDPQHVRFAVDYDLRGHLLSKPRGGSEHQPEDQKGRLLFSSHVAKDHGCRPHPGSRAEGLRDDRGHGQDVVDEGMQLFSGRVEIGLVRFGELAQRAIVDEGGEAQHVLLRAPLEPRFAIGQGLGSGAVDPECPLNELPTAGLLFILRLPVTGEAAAEDLGENPEYRGETRRTDVPPHPSQAGRQTIAFQLLVNGFHLALRLLLPCVLPGEEPRQLFPVGHPFPGDPTQPRAHRLGNLTAVLPPQPPGEIGEAPHLLPHLEHAQKAGPRSGGVEGLLPSSAAKRSGPRPRDQARPVQTGQAGARQPVVRCGGQKAFARFPIAQI